MVFDCVLIIKAIIIGNATCPHQTETDRTSQCTLKGCTLVWSIWWYDDHHMRSSQTLKRIIGPASLLHSLPLGLVDGTINFPSPNNPSPQTKYFPLYLLSLSFSTIFILLRGPKFFFLQKLWHHHHIGDDIDLVEIYVKDVERVFEVKVGLKRSRRERLVTEGPT